MVSPKGPNFTEPEDTFANRGYQIKVFVVSFLKNEMVTC